MFTRYARVRVCVYVCVRVIILQFRFLLLQIDNICLQDFIVSFADTCFEQQSRMSASDIVRVLYVTVVSWISIVRLIDC